MVAFRRARLFVVVSVLAGLLLMTAPDGAALAAPPDTGPQSGSASAALPKQKPGDHRGQEQYFESLRQASGGITPGVARANALKQAAALPTEKTLPAAVGGKRTAIGRDLAVPNTPWQPLGPAPEDGGTVRPCCDYQFGHVSGRATALVVGPHTGVLYLGTADGGVWKSTNDGASWSALTDGQPSLSTGSLALDPADTTDNTLYVGTGETNYAYPNGFNGDSYFGVGVLKTTNGGASWTVQPLSVATTGYTANSIGIGVMVANGASVWAGTTKGLYHSTNGGGAWAAITVNATAPTARVTDVAVDGANVYVVLSEATTGNASTGVYKSTTSGASGSFSAITSGLPATSTWGRAQLAMAPSNHQILYLVIVDGSGNLLSFDKTVNGGASWAATTVQPANYFDGFAGFGPEDPNLVDPDAGQGQYDSFVVVDPADPNKLYAGGVNLIATYDGGASWSFLSNVYGINCGAGPLCTNPQPHPDNHAAAFGRPGSPGHPFYAANDGGIFKTADGTLGNSTVFTSLNTNLNTTQFYAGDVAANYQTTPIAAGGAQDNGTSRTATMAQTQWNAVLGGDGGYVAIDKTNANTMYMEYQKGAVQKTTNANQTGAALSVTNISPIGGCTSSSLFIAPLTIDPNNNQHLVFGGRSVCESVNGGASWYRSYAGTFTNNQTQSVAIAPSNSAVIYAGSASGGVYRTTTGNTGAATTWTDIFTGKGLPTTPVTSIAVYPTDPNIAFATFGNFGVGHVWVTGDGGAIWSDISNNLPNAPFTSVVTYPGMNGPVIVAAGDVGVFVCANFGSGCTWSALMNGLPNVGVNQLILDKAQTTLVAATHGRGMWEVSIPAGFSVLSLSETGGPTTGGQTVTITGAGFGTSLAAVTASFGGANATVTRVTNTAVTVTTPAHAAGVVDVSVTIAGATVTLSGKYVYGDANPAPAPKVTATPPAGATASPGGGGRPAATAAPGVVNPGGTRR